MSTTLIPPVKPLSVSTTAVKSTLARLLATENISVQHENIPTALFDLQTRSLHLPLWSNTSGSLYDMLVGHEVAHALYTPVDGWRSAISTVSTATGVSPETAKQYLNIVEDARIERLIQAKFRGLRADFKSGYKTLMDRNFFGDLSKISTALFADRFNIHFKCGVHAGTQVQFSPDEVPLVARGETITTWDEVVQLATDMILISLSQKEKQKPSTEQDSAKTNADTETGEDTTDTEPLGDEASETETLDEEPSDTGSNDKDSNKEQNTSENSSDTHNKSDSENGIVPSTNRTLEEQLKTLTDTNSGAPSCVVQMTLCNTDSSTIVIPFTRIIADLSATPFIEKMKIPVHIADYTSAANTMTTAFNRKKAADVFRRSTMSKSGVLDTLRMNQYKWTDDIFRKTTRIAEGKNHGIVILLDWSGSMNRIMQSTIGQLFIITDFCRKAGIPFEVYAFTNSVYTEKSTDLPFDYINKLNEKEEAKQKTNTHVNLCRMNLLNFMSSKMKADQYEMMKSALWNWKTMELFDRRFSLNSTPTIAALFYASDVVAKFQAANRVQIMHTVVLTDGDPTDGLIYSLTDRGGEAESNKLSRSWETAVVMSDPLTGASYDINLIKKKGVHYGTYYTYGNVVFDTKDAGGVGYIRDWYNIRIALDVLRRRTGCKIHWIGLVTSRTINPKSYNISITSNNYSRDGFVRGTVAGWDSAVLINAERFQRNSDGSVAWRSQKLLSSAQSKLNSAKSKREIQSAFMNSQIAAGSLRTVANIVGEYLAV